MSISLWDNKSELSYVDIDKFTLDPQLQMEKEAIKEIKCYTIELAYKLLAQSYIATNQIESAKQTAESFGTFLRAFNKIFPISYSLLGYVFMDLNQFTEAIAVFKEVLRINDNNEIAKKNLKKCQEILVSNNINITVNKEIVENKSPQPLLNENLKINENLEVKPQDKKLELVKTEVAKSEVVKSEVVKSEEVKTEIKEILRSELQKKISLHFGKHTLLYLKKYHKKVLY